MTAQKKIRKCTKILDQPLARQRLRLIFAITDVAERIQWYAPRVAKNAAQLRRVGPLCVINEELKIDGKVVVIATKDAQRAVTVH